MSIFALNYFHSLNMLGLSAKEIIKLGIHIYIKLIGVKKSAKHLFEAKQILLLLLIQMHFKETLFELKELSRKSLQ